MYYLVQKWNGGRTLVRGPYPTEERVMRAIGYTYIAIHRVLAELNHLEHFPSEAKQVKHKIIRGVSGHA